MSLSVKASIVDILEAARNIQSKADEFGIVSVFDDGGYRELLLLRLLGLTRLPGRGGDDAIDLQNGLQYELKTVNLVNTKGVRRVNPGVTTCHHVNLEIIARYRRVAGWIIGIFYINNPVEIYEVATPDLEKYFRAWEIRLTNSTLLHINNPKISFADVRLRGTCIYRDAELASRYLP